jgi:hypothetical protein
MRKIILSLLMASVAVTPAIARDRTDRDDEVRTERQQSREDRQQSREDRQQSREDRQQSRENRQQVRDDRQVQAERSFHQSGVSGHADARADRADVERIRAVRETQRGQLEQRHQEMRDNRELRQSQRATQAVRNRPPVVSHVPRPGTQPPAPTTVRHSAPVHWNTSWRNNHRYDWHNWRNRHRSLFRLGFYSDPFGWGYQPYSIGWRMWPNYYRSSSYWLNDPWQYRLPYAPPGTRWIRYYNDAILVDTWSGQVVDVIYNFFW